METLPSIVRAMVKASGADKRLAQMVMTGLLTGSVPLEGHPKRYVTIATAADWLTLLRVTSMLPRPQPPRPER